MQKKCSSCRCWKDSQDYISRTGRILKTCIRCRIKKEPIDQYEFITNFLNDNKDCWSLINFIINGTV